MSWAQYVKRVAKSDNQTHIAGELHLNPSSVGRWFAGSTPKVMHVRAFAEHYKRDYTEAFLHAAGFSESDVSRIVTEVYRRLRREGPPDPPGPADDDPAR